MPAYFVLTPGSLPQADNFLCRPFLGTRSGRDTQMPWVTVATGVTNRQFDLIARSQTTPEAAQQSLAEAQQHLQSQAITWDVAEKRGLFVKKPWLLRAVLPQQQAPTLDRMDDLSSEQILNTSALMEASRTLGSHTLIAIVPKRGWLLVGIGNPGDPTARKYMLEAANGVFGRAEAQAISPYAFYWQDGQLTGYEAREETSGYISLLQPQESEWFPQS